MLEPTEADIPALFLVLVVLPLVFYILLGKWGEATKKRERVSLLAQLAAEETIRTGEMASATVMPLVSSFNNEPSTIPVSSSSSCSSALKSGQHACARCFSPAKTRCSRCKSVRYCSGKCQIIHWRQVHKYECHQLESTSSNSSPKPSFSDDLIHEQFLLNEGINSQLSGYNSKQTVMMDTPSDNVSNSSKSTLYTAMGDSETDPSQVVMHDRVNIEKPEYCKSDRGSLSGKDKALFGLSAEGSESGNTSTTYSNVRNRDNSVLEEGSKKFYDSSYSGYIYGQPASSVMDETQQHQIQEGMVFGPKSNCGYLNPPYLVKTCMNMCSSDANIIMNGGPSSEEENASIDEMAASNCSEMARRKGSKKTKAGLSHAGFKASKLPKSKMNISGQQPCSDIDRKGQVPDDSKSKMKDVTHTHGSEDASDVGIMRIMDLRKSTKPAKHNTFDITGDRYKKIKMLFPYEEFVKYFQCEVYGLSLRGLINCGNSCYANAVLQCLTCTKPLLIYLLRRSHSRTCSGKAWCLICELEEYVMMLRESGGPLSPSRILSHMRNFNCQLGDGSQEDAHEFLRLLIASMQSICLERQGGESKVDPRLQETTFIQHTFGGRLRSKVQCLRCHHESERYENIMDLTLEIFGWVESLEDALTQFTTPEDLDGENMYRCGSCAAYVRARKQLSIHQAPNILTIVLKRFQEGKYGKINKCIAFPDMLDMIPFMTGTGDVPPLYMLYGVVVHLDTLNASFSGHYISYVKDMQGNWNRIDDTEVQPVSVGQVMSEGAYILFYMRSWPRPESTVAGNAMRQPHKSQKISRSGKIQSSSRCIGPEPSSFLRPETVTDFMKHHNSSLRRADKNILPPMETYAESVGMEFSDATSSDWSLFTSSDEASFTTESTRDSFSTVDYADAYNTDPLSIFNNLYGQDYSARNTVSCRTYMNSKSETRILYEDRGYVIDSYMPIESLNGLQECSSVDWLYN